MSAAVAPQFDPQAAWEALVAKGVPKEQASLHVLRQVQNQPADIAAQYLKDIDPGWLAALGSGFSQASTLGFGDELAGLLEGAGAALVPGGRGFGEAYRGALEGERLTRAEGRRSHPAAYWTGEALGTAPWLAGAAITKAPAAGGVILPALTRAVPALNRAGAVGEVARGLARVALGAAKGGTLAGAEAAGRTDNDLAERAKNAAAFGLEGAKYGAAAAATPIALRALFGEAGVIANALRWAGGKPVPALPAPKVPGYIPTAAAGVLPLSILMPRAPTPEEVAMARLLGIPVESVHGRVGPRVR